MNAQAPPGTRAIQLRQPDLFFSRFLELYGRPNRLTLPERNGKANLGQALHMLAGSAYQEKVSCVRRGDSNVCCDPVNQTARSFATSTWRLTRGDPSRVELEDLERAIGVAENREQALGDFVWAVLCSREFAENH